MYQKKFKIGTLEDIKEVVEKLNKKFVHGGQFKYTLESVPEQENLWVVKEEQPEATNCAVILVQDGAVFAISEDVYKLLLDWFLQVL